MRKVIIIGAGGQGKVIKDIVLACNDEFVGFLDDNYAQFDESAKVLGKISDVEKYIDQAEFMVGIGNNFLRRDIVERLETMNARFYTAIHPSAVISANAQVGEGTTVMPCAVINTCAEVGKHCIINTGAIVEHDNKIENFVHISPRVALGGAVTVGECTWVGIGSVVRNELLITGGCVIGAGAVVVRSITEKGKYIGVPVRKVNGV